MKRPFETEEREAALELESGRERFATLMRLSERRLWLGDTRRALKHLEDAHDICEKAGASVPLRFVSSCMLNSAWHGCESVKTKLREL